MGATISVQNPEYDDSKKSFLGEVRQHWTKAEDDWKTDKATTMRMIQLNENTKKRRMQFTYIILIWVAAFLIIIFLLLFCKFLPEWFPCNLFIWLVVMAALFGTFYLYRELSFRDNTDYDKLSLVPPSEIKSNKNKTIDDISNNDYDLSLGNCTGKECCEIGTFWNANKGRCTVMDLSSVDWSELNDSMSNLLDMGSFVS